MESSFSFNHQYSLKWNDFHKKLVNSFQCLQKSDEFVDVTIACEGKSFSAHKVVLSACSPYFRKLLKANPCSHPIIILQTIAYQHFENLLSFMYHGVVNIEPESLHEFLRAANALQIQGLADIQYPYNIFNRKTSTESDASLGPTNVNESSEECVSPRPKNKVDEPEQTNAAPAPPSSEKPPSTITSPHDLSSIDNIIDMNLPSPKAFSAAEPPKEQTYQQAPKVEPIDDLVIDEDAFEPETTDPPTKPPDIPTFSGSLNYPDQFSNRATSMSENFMASKKWQIGNTENNRCIVCKRNYSSPSNLRAHVLNVHIQTSKTNWFECRVCGKKCKTKHYLINHEMQKHGIRQRSKRPSYVDFVNEDTM